MPSLPDTTTRPDLLAALDPAVLHCCRQLALRLQQAGGEAWVVGGAVRDALLGLPVKDLDVEVYGLPPDDLERVLRQRWSIDEVGRAFGVLKIKGQPIDISLPRRESKSGLGHKGFTVASDPFLPRPEAALRRDFTVNAILWNPLTGALDDPLGGQADLAAGLLRHCGPSFREDPLRVLRGMQFVARFQFTPDPATIALCRTIEPEGLPPERLFEEWKKLLLQGRSLSAGLRFLHDTGWVRHYPELNALVGCPQDPEWHPEGDVWVHTLHCLDAFARERLGDPREDLVVGLAVLCHDLGKPATTEYSDGHIRSLGHEEQGEMPTRSFLERLTRQQDLIEEVVVLVLHHLKPHALYKTGAGDAAVRRLARKVGRIDRLLRLAAADHSGRPPLPGTPFPALDWLRDTARRLQVEDAAPPPLILGRHLLERGWKPGPHFKPVLEAAYDAQLEGAFSSLPDALAWLDAYLLPNSPRESPAHP